MDLKGLWIRLCYSWVLERSEPPLEIIWLCKRSKSHDPYQCIPTGKTSLFFFPLPNYHTLTYSHSLVLQCYANEVQTLSKCTSCQYLSLLSVKYFLYPKPDRMKNWAFNSIEKTEEAFVSSSKMQWPLLRVSNGLLSHTCPKVSCSVAYSHFWTLWIEGGRGYWQFPGLLSAASGLYG